jgi:LysW-gamma-L-alpha-aminoadipyl-6-phosphate/LysW-L-glutamyl-5-phosphate reductase
MKTAAIIGGSGYAGGELLRLLIQHPEIDVKFITSRKHIGEFVHQVHPNLRGHSLLKFTDAKNVTEVNIVFLALPHGNSQKMIETFANKASIIIDLAGDFRLNNAEVYETWYGNEHTAPEWLEKFTYGLPELHRANLLSAKYISGVGCNATASILSLLPLIQADLIDKAQKTIIEIKVGSSESGALGNRGSHHPERSSVIRTFSSFGHRHTAEVEQELGMLNVILTMTAVDIVRGALATAHVVVRDGVTQKDLWQAYRTTASENPFIRVVKERKGIYRVPEPKILAGSNYADIGFEFNPKNGQVVSICAIDNLMKGASGSAVQSMNLALGFEETLGLSFMGLHPS